MSSSAHSALPRQSADAAHLVSSGLIARVDTLARALTGRFDGGPADGTRFIDVAMADGMSFRVLPDRGLDIGEAWAGGRPIGWMSPVGYSGPATQADRAGDVDGMGWLSRFTGGLLTTCGPDNIGLPSVDDGTMYGLHGSWSDLSASDVTIQRVTLDDRIELTISADLVHRTPTGEELHIRRTITTSTGTAWVGIVDHITNSSTQSLPIPMLYHLNFGAPMWGPGALVSYPAGTQTNPRNDHAHLMMESACDGPTPEAGAQEYVYERVVPAVDTETTGVTVSNPAAGMSATVTWDAQTLPTSHQWVHPAANYYALGIEPANAALAGRAALRATGALPMIEAGEQQRFSVQVSVTTANTLR